MSTHIRQWLEEWQALIEAIMENGLGTMHHSLNDRIMSWCDKTALADWKALESSARALADPRIGIEQKAAAFLQFVTYYEAAMHTLVVETAEQD